MLVWDCVRIFTCVQLFEFLLLRPYFYYKISLMFHSTYRIIHPLGCWLTEYSKVWMTEVNKYPCRITQSTQISIHQSCPVPPKENNCCSSGDGYHRPSYLRLDTAGQEARLIRPAALLRCEKALRPLWFPLSLTQQEVPGDNWPRISLLTSHRLAGLKW